MLHLVAATYFSPTGFLDTLVFTHHVADAHMLSFLNTILFDNWTRSGQYYIALLLIKHISRYGSLVRNSQCAIGPVEVVFY